MPIFGKGNKEKAQWEARIDLVRADQQSTMLQLEDQIGRLCTGDEPYKWLEIYQDSPVRRFADISNGTGRYGPKSAMDISCRSLDSRRLPARSA